MTTFYLIVVFLAGLIMVGFFNTRVRKQKWFFSIAMAIGVISLLSALSNPLITHWRVQHSLPAIGRAIDWEERKPSSRGSSTKYYPIIEFDTQAGEKVVFESQSGDYKKWFVTSMVPVVYIPNNPHIAYINHQSFLYLYDDTWKLLSTLGVIILFLGLITKKNWNFFWTEPTKLFKK